MKYVKKLIAAAIIFSLALLPSCKGNENPSTDMIPATPTDYYEVPFTDLSSDSKNEYKLLYNGQNFKIKNDNFQYELKNDCIPLDITETPAGTVVFYKNCLGDNINISVLSKKSTIELEVPDFMKSFIFRDSIYFEEKNESSLYFVLYNVVTSKHQLYKYDLAGGQFVFADGYWTDLSFGDSEIDENVKMRHLETWYGDYGNPCFAIFGTQNMYIYKNWSPISISSYKYADGSRFIEFYKNETGEYILSLDESSFTYILSDFNNTVIGRLQDQGNQSVKLLKEPDSVPLMTLIQTPQDRIEQLREDMTTLPCHGIMNLGDNNMEGRIAWSQVYYLNGMIDLLLPQFRDVFGKYAEYDKLCDDINTRLNIEISILNKIICSDKSLNSVRYTVNRQDSIVLLHLKRIQQVLSRYLKYADAPIAFVDMNQIAALEKSPLLIESLVSAPANDINGVKQGCYYFVLNKSMMLFDTAAPYNYMTGYASGIFMQELILNNQSGKQLRIASDFTSILMESDHFLDFDENGEWPYLFGESYTGWQNKPYRNVVSFDGQEYVADISYRSMDASAILLKMDVFPEYYDEATAKYIDKLIAKGKLYPFVNEVLVETDNKIVAVDRNALTGYSRVRHAWELQNSVWSFYFSMMELS